MNNIREVVENIYYVGVNDRRLKRFENMFDQIRVLVTTLM